MFEIIDRLTISKFLGDKHIVILGILSGDVILDSFFCASLSKIKLDDCETYLMTKEEYEKTQKKEKLYPTICSFLDGKIYSKSYGFKNYKKMIEDLNIKSMYV